MKIVIDKFYKGISPSAITGFQEIRGLNILDKPGACYPNPAMVNDTDAVIADIIEGTAKDGTIIYAYSNNDENDVYKRASGGTWSLLTGYADSKIVAIATWKGAVIVLHSDFDFDASVNDGVDWTQDFDTNIGSVSNASAPIIIDEVLYWGIDNKIYAMSEVADKTFDPTDNTTWEFALGLTLPDDLIVTTLAELNGNLLIGTKPYTSEDQASCLLFLWNTSNPDPTEKIFVEERSINYLVSTNNLAYFQAGDEGEWYVTNGTTVNFINKLPLEYINGKSADVGYPSACAIWRNKIFFAFLDNSARDKLGIYSLDIRTGVINYEHVISTGNVGLTEGVIIGTITNTATELVITWSETKVTPTFGADAISLGDAGYTGDKSFLVSRLYPISDNLSIDASARFNVHLTKPLATGDSVKVYYREKAISDVTVATGGWTQITELTMATVGDQNLSVSVTLPQLNSIQFLIFLNDEAELFYFDMVV